MAYTITAGTGSNVTGSTDPTPTYPATGMGAGKLAVMAVATAHGSGSDWLVPPAGWTQMGGTPTNFAAINSEATTLAIWSKVLDGSEAASSSVSVDNFGTTGRKAAKIWVIDTSGGTGWNFENQNWVGQATASTTIADRGVTTGGANRLAVNVVVYNERQTTQEDFAGETGGTWVASDFYDGGNYPTISLQTSELASAGTINGGADTSITSSTWLIFGFSVWRNAASLPDLTVTDITYTPSSPVVGSNVTFSAVINNVGAAATPGSTVHKVNFTINNNVVATSTSRTTSIAASGNATVAADAAWVPSYSGTFSVIATVDPDGIISESNEGNNTYAENISVGEADAVLRWSEAVAAGMPNVEVGAVGSGLEISKVNANFTLLAASSGRYFLQSYRNVAASAVLASAPSGYTIDGSAVIEPGTAGLFMKVAGTNQFIRWN